MAASDTQLMTRIWRYGPAAAAAAVYVWFVIGARQAHEESTAIVGPKLVTARLPGPLRTHDPFEFARGAH
jgi:hypothetical protein